MKHSNSIVVGGPIAVGKSTLVGSLPFLPVQELDPNDELQKLLLYRMYQGDQAATQLFSFDILINRHRKYLSLANRDRLTVFDRSLFEDIFFASNLLKNSPNVLAFYRGLWESFVEDIINEAGRPKLYILLTCSWEVFKRRLFERDRKAETDNFAANEQYFFDMVKKYKPFMLRMFKRYGLEYVVIDTDNKTETEVNDYVKSYLLAKGING